MLCRAGWQVNQESVSLSLKPAEEVSLNTRGGWGGSLSDLFAFFIPCAKKKKLMLDFFFQIKHFSTFPNFVTLCLKEFLVKYLFSVCGDRNLFLCGEPVRIHKYVESI